MLKTLSLTPEEGRDGTETETDDTERRMRQALEALSGPRSDPARTEPLFRQDRPQRRDMPRNDGPAPYGAKGRHRFVKDGEIPVVHMTPPRPRDAGSPEPDQARLQQIIEDQRIRLDAAERAARDAQAQLRVLQTKCAHTEMALADATALAEHRLREIEELREQVKTASVPPPRTAPALSIAGEPAPRRPGGRPRTVVIEAEPEPVQWWLAPVKGKRR